MRNSEILRQQSELLYYIEQVEKKESNFKDKKIKRIE